MNKEYKLESGKRVYAIGDIHGHLEQLEQLHTLIYADIKSNPADDITIVYIGDYIDRGPESKGVIDFLIQRELVAKSINHVFLLGNHELGMLEFMRNPDGARKDWLLWGGVETAASYGVDVVFERALNEAIPMLSKALKEAVPDNHYEFLKNLKKLHAVDDYVFAHAGIRPKVALDKQRTTDVTFIREGFLDSEIMHEQRVVHGHTITQEYDIEIHPNRIAIDTGIYKGGPLSCVILQEDQVRKLQVWPPMSEEELEDIEES